MLQIIASPDADEIERRMAAVTIADALFPQQGQYGAGMEDLEQDVTQSNEMDRDLDEEEAKFAAALEQAMKERGLTQAALAELVGVGQPAISNMLNRRCRPQQRTVRKLAEALQVDPAALWPALGK